jgi:hypothetical protein
MHMFTVFRAGVEAPVNLGGFFGVDSDDSDADKEEGFNEVYEIQELELCGRAFKIRSAYYTTCIQHSPLIGLFVLLTYFHHALYLIAMYQTVLMAQGER